MKSPNRRYTGLEKTPSSMAWLLKQRAEVRGKLDRAKRRLMEYERQLARQRFELDALKAELATLPILPRRTTNSARLFEGRGQVEASIMTILREANPSPMSTAAIADRFALTVVCNKAHLDAFELRYRIRSTLVRLRDRGSVRASTSSRKDGTNWSISNGDVANV